MVIDLCGIIVKGKRLDRMVDFLFTISDRVELVSTATSDMTKEEYVAARYELRKSLKETGEEDVLGTDIDEMFLNLTGEEDFFYGKTKEEIQEEIVVLRTQAKERISERESSFITKEDITSHLKMKFKGLCCRKRVVTCRTHCTTGGPRVVYSFSVNEELKKRFRNLEVLTCYFKDEKGSYLADNPAFYCKDKLICSICSHESYIFLHLEEEQMNVFKAFGIPYYTDSTRDTPSFPCMDETLRIISSEPVITTLLGKEIIDYHEDNLNRIMKFSIWFNENYAKLRDSIEPRKRSVKEIMKYLKERYVLEPFQSRCLEIQCQRNAWDRYYLLPFNDIITNRSEDRDLLPTELDSFLYKLNYHGKELLIGGEYKSNYLFADSLDAEDKLKKLLETQNEMSYYYSDSNGFTEDLFHFIRELNEVKGIDEYDIYDSMYLKNYIYSLKYEEMENGILSYCPD